MNGELISFRYVDSFSQKGDQSNSEYLRTVAEHVGLRVGNVHDVDTSGNVGQLAEQIERTRQQSLVLSGGRGMISNFRKHIANRPEWYIFRIIGLVTAKGYMYFPRPYEDVDSESQ